MERNKFSCSGPMPGAIALATYRTAQDEAIGIIQALGYPICMGLVEDAEKQVKELQQQLTIMKECTK